MTAFMAEISGGDAPRGSLSFKTLYAVGAVLLIKAFFDNAGVDVPLGEIKLWGLPTALCVIAIGWWRYRRLDARLARSAAKPAAAREVKGPKP